jgi:hypothetical protein
LANMSGKQNCTQNFFIFGIVVNTLMICHFMFTISKISEIDSIIDDYNMANSQKKQSSATLHTNTILN